MNLHFEPCTRLQIEPYVQIAMQEQLVFNSNTQLYKVLANGVMIGFTGIQRYSNKCVFKNDWILPEHRGKGYYMAILQWKMNMCQNVRIESTCTKMSLSSHLKSGFKIIQRYKNGCTKVAYENLQQSKRT